MNISEPQTHTGESSRSRIVKSTAIIGVSNAISTAIRIARMKVFALLLGPTGIGLLGLYTAVMSTVATVSGMGVGSSGVRQIAHAKGDQHTMARALSSLRLVTVCLGTIGALSLILLSRAISLWTFGNYSYVVPLALLSLGVLFQVISDSQTAVLNGLCRVRELALVNIIGTLIGTIVAVIIVWLKGVTALPYLVIIPVLSMLACSWWARRRIPVIQQRLPWRDLKIEATALLSLGVAFMLAGLMMTGALLFTRLIFASRLGLAATGYFQAAWGIAVINVDFILNAMGIDFYPHLTGCIKDDRSAGNRLVNEQTEVALLFGGPLIIGMLTASGLLVRLFYSAQFILATGLLRWLLLGSILKIVSWPMGYLVMAHGWAKASLWVEFVWCSSYIGVLYLACSRYNVKSAGYAFVTAYLIYATVVYGITHVYGGFRWTQRNLLHTGSLLFAGLFIMILASVNSASGYVVGGILTIVVSILSMKRLSRMIDHPAARRLARFMSPG